MGSEMCIRDSVLPALIRRFYEAKESGAESVICWGTGSPRREFLHVDDLGDACVFALENWKPSTENHQFLNVGSGIDLTIRELAESIAENIGYLGKIIWDESKPDGTPKKQLDISKLQNLGWSASIPLSEGLQNAISAFRSEKEKNTIRSN